MTARTRSIRKRCNIFRHRTYDLTSLMSDLFHNSLPVNAFLFHEYWRDVGRLDDLERAKEGVATKCDYPHPER
jgi:NDP-sugar pyrophosphorylase family protein